MEREELEAMWERIKALEENSLKVSKALAAQSIISVRTEMGTISALKGKHKAFQAYMNPKMEEAGQKLDNAQNVDEVIKIVREFSDDCINFTGSILE